MPTEKQTTLAAVEPVFYFFSNDGTEEDASGQPCSNSQLLGSGTGPTIQDAFEDFLKDNPNRDNDFTEVWGIQVVGDTLGYFTILLNPDTAKSLL